MLSIPFVASLLNLASPSWEASIERLLEDQGPIGAEAFEAAAARATAVIRPVPALVDKQGEAATVRYTGGAKRIKRTRYAPVDLVTRRIVIVVHQMGVERGPSTFEKRVAHTTAHYGIGPDGVPYKLHPHNCRLIEANAFDRSPWHGIGIEVGGNFEGTDGEGDWYKPEKFGHGRASDVQLNTLRWLIDHIVEQVALEERGAAVHGVAPHRVAGRSTSGRPNRPLCPGSRVWSAAEGHAIERDLAVPGEGWTLGGMKIPREWRSDAYTSQPVRVFA